MEQKNTIVKCTAHPDCLFCHNGICDNYVIIIGADGSCQEYVETENDYTPPSTQEILEYTIKLEQEKLTRGQREKCNFYEDKWIDPEIIKEGCQPFHLCDTKCKYWQLNSYSEWVCGCMADDFNPHGYCPRYDDGGEE